MQWSKPEFQDITLNMEVTAYVNTDDSIVRPVEVRREGEPSSSATAATQKQE